MLLLAAGWLSGCGPGPAFQSLASRMQSSGNLRSRDGFVINLFMHFVHTREIRNIHLSVYKRRGRGSVRLERFNTQLAGLQSARLRDGWLPVVRAWSRPRHAVTLIYVHSPHAAHPRWLRVLLLSYDGNQASGEVMQFRLAAADFSAWLAQHRTAGADGF